MAVINISKTMREHAWLRKGKRLVEKLNVSGKAEKEYLSYLNSYIETHMAVLSEYAKKAGRKTILEEDVIRLFSNKDVMPLGGD